MVDSPVEPKPTKFRQVIKNRILSVAKSTSHKQLEAAICSLTGYVERLKIEYDLNKNRPIAKTVKQPATAASAQQPAIDPALNQASFEKALTVIKNELVSAKNAADNWETQQGWNHYYEAELLSFYLMDKEDWKARAKLIFNGSEEALDECEKKAVRDLIGKSGEGGVWVVQNEDKLEKQKVIEARRVVQTHYTDAYTKLNMSLKQLRILAVIAIAVVSIIIFSLVIVPNTTAVVFNVSNSTTGNLTSPNTITNATGSEAINNSTIANYTFTTFFFLGVVLFGALGGTASAMITIARSSKGDVPERLLNSWLTLAKPVFGAVAALAVAVFLLAGLLQSIEGILKPTAAITTYAVFAISFASGFSERILLRAVGEDSKNGKS